MPRDGVIYHPGDVVEAAGVEETSDRSKGWEEE
jgi:hypothetical protein